MIAELVQRMVGSVRRGHPTYIGPFLFHLYQYHKVLTQEEKTMWETHSAMAELEATDSEPEAPTDDEEDQNDTSDEEEKPSKKKSRMREPEVKGSPATRTRSAIKAVVDRPARMQLRDTSLDSIIRDLEEVRVKVGSSESILLQVEELVGNPPRSELVAAVKDAVEGPLRI